jgi:hypothetical protein
MVLYGPGCGVSPDGVLAGLVGGGAGFVVADGAEAGVGAEVVAAGDGG